ncbi:33791_t:CDS:1, partial [Racocetra persica]
QARILHYEKLEPCEIMCRNLKDNFRFYAKIVPDDYQEPTMIQIIERHFSNIFDFDEGLTNKKDIFLVGGIIHTVDILKNLPKDNLKLTITWYFGSNHIITIWGGLNEPLVSYSCYFRGYFPYWAHERARAHKDFDYILDTDACKKYENYVYEISNKHYAYCAAKM